MPLFLLIRHGESTANVREFELALAARAQRLTPAQLAQQRLHLTTQPGTGMLEPNGDAELTANGRTQAELLGQFWAKILQHRAQQGRVHIIVSPMTRNLQTADPLVRVLNKQLRCGKENTNSVRAVINPDLVEIPGFFHPDDAHMFFNLQARLVPPAGAGGQGFDRPPESDRNSSRDVTGKYSWRPAGLSGNDIKRKFPWCRIPHCMLEPRDVGWWQTGCESMDDIEARAVRLADSIEEMRETLHRKDVVVIFTHGLMHNLLLNLLMARQFYGVSGGGDNAVADSKFRSISRKPGSLFDRGWVQMHPGSNTSTSCLSWDRGTRLVVHFLHRVDHLGPETGPDTLMRGYQHLGLANLEGQQKSKEHLVGYWGLKRDVAGAKL